MKRYSISYAREVNREASKTGLLFQYGGRTDNPERVIELFEKTELEAYQCKSGLWFFYDIGIQIKDSVTKEIVYSCMRANDSDELLDKATKIRRWCENA